MSACSPHDNVLQPCANDAVGSLQALGVTGDIAFAEYGNMPLAKDQDSIDIEFLYEKTDWRYVFVYLYVGKYDQPPNEAIQCAPGSQTTKGFTVKFTGAPTDDESILFWEVRIPDNLQICQSLTSEPKYAIVPPSQEGEIALVPDQDFIEVTFPEEHPTANWIGEFNIEKGSEIEETATEFFVCTITTRTAFGFVLTFQGAPTTDAYTLRWRIS